MRRGAPSWKAALQAWYDESRHVDWAAPAWNAAAAQFTQLVWRGTKAVGCAANRECRANADGGGGPVYVCYFSPAGNVIGVNWRRQVGRAPPVEAAGARNLPAPRRAPKGGAGDAGGVEAKANAKA